MVNNKDKDYDKNLIKNGIEENVNEEKFLEIPSYSNIQIVEDEKYLIRLISRILNENGFTSDKASSIKEAMTKLSKKFYDIVFLDLRLPDGSGLSLLESIVDIYAGTIVIVITGIHDLNTAIRTIRTGAYDYITKPFSILLFQERLNSVIDEWKSRTFSNYYQSYLENLVIKKLMS